MRYHFTSSRKTIIKMTDITRVGKDVEESMANAK
jgi:hypothetical protein